MKHLLILILFGCLLSCGNNTGTPDDDDDQDVKPDTTIKGPGDTVVIDTVESLQAIGNRKGVDQSQIKSIVYYQVVKRTFKYKL